MVQLGYRTLKAYGLIEGPPSFKASNIKLEDESSVQPADTRCCCFSPNGDLFALAENQCVRISRPQDGTKVAVLQVPLVTEMEFSPGGSFLVTWERPSKLPDGNSAENLKIWRLHDFEVVCAFVQLRQQNWRLQFTANDEMCARLHNGEVRFYETENFKRGPVSRFQAAGASEISISPGNTRYIAVFFPEKGGTPGWLKVFELPLMQTPVSMKSFFKCDKVHLHWNALGTCLLVLTHTEVDQSNRSYYGETNLYLLNMQLREDCRVALPKEGPIHDVTWSPDSKEFAAVYGYMPATTSIFDQRGNVIENLPEGPRNTFKYSPHGQLFISAGFGNLNGTMHIYQRKGLRKIAAINASDSTICEWAPDGVHIMTAITSPRLRVDNGIKIWHFTGRLVFAEPMDNLYQVSWRPEDIALYPFEKVSKMPSVIHSSAASHPVEHASKTAGAYRPPRARSAGVISANGIPPASSFSVADLPPPQKYVPGISSGRSVPGLGSKNQETGTARKKNPATATNDTVVSKALNPAQSSEKKKKTLFKKLKEIEELKLKTSCGIILEQNQLQKIEKELEIRQAIESIDRQ